eukprot:33761_1
MMLSSLRKTNSILKYTPSLITTACKPLSTSKPLVEVEEVHKIKQITVYQCDLPLLEGSYNWSSGKSISTFDSTIVSIETDTGYIGYGEVTPLGPFYLPSYALGVRSGLQQLCKDLIGMNAINISSLNHYMDLILKGHPYIKSPIDMACWDILGKISNLPLCILLGGRFGENVDLYRAISQLPPKQMSDNVAKYRDEGYTKFQLKCGSTVDDDISRIKLVRNNILNDNKFTLVADANTGWLTHEAMTIVKNTINENVYIEEPCASYKENLQIRRYCQNPFIMDECIDNINTLIQASNDFATDCVNVKISKLGGITKAKEVRDLCIRLNIAMCIEDTWGGDITTSAIAHLAHSTPEKYRFSATDFNSYNSVCNADGSPQRINGTFKASNQPGLGINPRFDVLGQPVAVYK